MSNKKKTMCIAIGLLAAAFIAVGTGLSIYYTANNAVDILATVKTPSITSVTTEAPSLTTANSVTAEYLGPVRGDLPSAKTTTPTTYYLYVMRTKKATFLDSEKQPVKFPKGRYKVTAVRLNSNGPATMMFYYNNETRQKDFSDGFSGLQISLRFSQTTFLSFEYVGKQTNVDFFVFREK